MVHSDHMVDQVLQFLIPLFQHQSYLPSAHTLLGLSAVGGTIRRGELSNTTGPISHALKIELYEYYFYNGGAYNTCYTWPATRYITFSFVTLSLSLPLSLFLSFSLSLFLSLFLSLSLFFSLSLPRVLYRKKKITKYITSLRDCTRNQFK